ncbi:hypothetical protein [Mycolicibacterium sphagni]|uniref:Uncharacterized protein n=1 Tax=Mycolicibacterium sphagni TaxID=1786 RepID=A0A255D730_9MYCO|nr:hypothetical protein [Mycolicibacterium sphagni]MCV7175292.1 hypothetical protein [Mycolicibacterium sphagni]OYN75209.1 hypothetical protein CG716_26250 [Mycolicibacterium sphagni]
MNRIRPRSVVAAIALTAGVIGLSTACSNSEKEAPTSTTTTTTTPASTSVATPSPTEKATVGGPNSFSPTVKATPAPTAIPGNNH